MMLFKAIKKPIPITVEEITENKDIETLEGVLHANADLDYIIHGVNGEEYPIKKDIFNKTYEVIDKK